MANKKTNLELLQELKQEIVRLGIQDYPSRTTYQKEYHRGEAPSPNSIMTRTGMKWDKIIETIGFNYDKSDMIRKRGAKGGKIGGKIGGKASKKGTNTGKFKTLRWNSKTDEEFLATVIAEFKRGGYRSLREYEQNRDKKVSPSAVVIQRRFNWRSVSAAEENLSKHLDWELGTKRRVHANKLE